MQSEHISKYFRQINLSSQIKHLKPSNQNVLSWFPTVRQMQFVPSHLNTKLCFPNLKCLYCRSCSCGSSSEQAQQPNSPVRWHRTLRKPQNLPFWCFMEAVVPVSFSSELCIAELIYPTLYGKVCLPSHESYGFITPWVIQPHQESPIPQEERKLEPSSPFCKSHVLEKHTLPLKGVKSQQSFSAK